MRISSACRWGLRPQVIFLFCFVFSEWLFSFCVRTNVFPNKLTRVLSCENIVWILRAVTAVFFFFRGKATFHRVSWLCFVKLLDRSLWEFISNRLLEWWRGFLGCCMKFKHYNYNRERFFLQCDEAADLCQSGLWQCKRFFFFHFHAPFKSLLWKTKQNWALSSCYYLSSMYGAIPWDELVPSAGVKDDYKPHAPSDTAGLPIKSSCTSCYVKTAALPYVSLQAIYSKKNKKQISPASVFIMTVRTRKHIITLCSCISNPIFFIYFFLVKNLLQVCGVWMDAAFSRWAACVFTVPLWR